MRDADPEKRHVGHLVLSIACQFATTVWHRRRCPYEQWRWRLSFWSPLVQTDVVNLSIGWRCVHVGHSSMRERLSRQSPLFVSSPFLSLASPCCGAAVARTVLPWSRPRSNRLPSQGALQRALSAPFRCKRQFLLEARGSRFSSWPPLDQHDVAIMSTDRRCRYVKHSSLGERLSRQCVLLVAPRVFFSVLLGDIVALRESLLERPTNGS